MLLLAATCLLAAAPSASAAKKKAAKPKLSTVTATTTSPTLGPVSATATCPKGSKALGGGLLAQPAPTNNDILNVLESRRVGDNAWRVSGYRLDSGGVGPVMSLSAEAYCRSGKFKARERSTTEGILDTPTTALPVATCPVGRAAVGGGFSITPPSNPNDLNAIVSTNFMTGGVGWLLRALKLGSPPLSIVNFTSYIYCLKKGQKGPKPVGGSASLPTPVNSAATATSAPCPGKRNPTAGGFRFPDLFTGPIIFVTESRRSGKSWVVSASRFSNTDPATIEAFGYCT